MKIPTGTIRIPFLMLYFGRYLSNNTNVSDIITSQVRGIRSALSTQCCQFCHPENGQISSTLTSTGGDTLVINQFLANDALHLN